MNRDHQLLIDVVRSPRKMANMSLQDWDVIVRLARRSNLLARLAHNVEELDLAAVVPEAPLAHLRAARMLSEKHSRVVAWEIDRVQELLGGLQTPLILLKGAAYVLGGLSCGRGRLFNDIDIMVTKPSLKRVEQALLLGGWVTTHHDSYDQKYYRMWMHELPPLIHTHRGTTLDVHHAIVPETSRLQSPSEPLFDAAVGIPGRPGLMMLSPADLVIHSAAHLFLEGEFDQGLRDLVDLDALVRNYLDSGATWNQLVERSELLNMILPLYYALRYTSRILGTPIPEEVQKALERRGPGARARLMDALFQRGLAPRHYSCADWLTGKALWMLYIRAHYLRMPLHLLVPHLVKKSLRPAS